MFRPPLLPIVIVVGHEAIIRLLVNIGKVNINSKDTKYSLTPLSWATREGHKAVVRLLLVIGKANINLKNTTS